MAVFSYKALNGQQSSVSGTIAADSPRQARDLLRSRGLVVQLIEDQRTNRPAFWTRPLMAAHTSGPWVTALSELSMLLSAGIPLLEALDTIARQQRGLLRTAVIKLRDRVAAGSSLAEAMGEQPEMFDPLAVHMVEVGENAGTLEAVLEQLAEFKQRSLVLKDQVVTALTYPVFLVVIGTAATLFIMTQVMPPLLENLQESLVELPWPTRVVKAGSDFLLNYGGLLAGVLAGGGILLGWLVRTPRGRRAWHRLLLRLPLVGTMALKQGVARIAMVIATLARSGVILTKALQLAARSTQNVVLREALEDCGTSVGEGRDVATALERTGVFPPLAVQIFSVGQESGRLEEMLNRLAADYQRQVAQTSARLAALLEPALIIVLALFVGFVMLATILPILEAGNVQ